MHECTLKVRGESLIKMDYVRPIFGTGEIAGFAPHAGISQREGICLFSKNRLSAFDLGKDFVAIQIAG